MRLGDNEYQVGGVGSDEDFSDLSIVSTPLGNDEVEIALSFSLHGPLRESLAQRALEMVCSTAENIASDTSMLIPSPNTLSALPKQTVEDSVEADDEDFIKSQLQTLGTPEALVLSNLVSQVWRQVLENTDQKMPLVKMNTSFFDLDGDIVNLAQVVCLLEQERIKVRLNDMIAHPTLRGQMAVIVQSNHEQWKKTGISAAETLSRGPASTLSNAVDPSSILRRKVPRNKSWVTAVSLARKMVRREPRTIVAQD